MDDGGAKNGAIDPSDRRWDRTEKASSENWSARTLGSPAARDRRRLLRPSLVPRIAENHSPQRRQGRGGHPWLRELRVAPLRGRAAPRRHCRLGQLGGADETPRNVSRLSERARVRW